MAKKEVIPQAESEIVLGPCKLASALLAAMPAQDYTRAGVVLVSERVKVSVKIGDMLVPVTLSLYATRGPVGNEEAAKVSDVKDERDKADEKKKLEAAETLAREKRTMFDLGQQSSSDAIMGTLANVPKLVQAAQMLSAMKITS